MKIIFIYILASEVELTKQSGEISSPMYPKPYRDSEDYSWTITVDQRKQVQIVIKEFMTTSKIHSLKVKYSFNIFIQLIVNGNQFYIFALRFMTEVMSIH